MSEIACVKDKYSNKLVPILEMWESFSGWYWFITEIDKEEPAYAFGFVHGFEDEWGSINREELMSLRVLSKVWKVPQKNWFSNSYVVMANREQGELKEVAA